jgi:hypothetical protein
MAGEINDSRIVAELAAINKTLAGIAESLAKIVLILATPPGTPTDLHIETGK